MSLNIYILNETFFTLFDFTITIYGISQSEKLIMIFKRHTNLKYKYVLRLFLYKGYFADKIKISKNLSKISKQKQTTMCVFVPFCDRISQL